MMRHASFRAGEDQADAGLVVVGRVELPGLWVLSRLASSRGSGSAAGVVFAVGGRGGAAAFALPGLVAFFYGERGDGERDGGIGLTRGRGLR
jgi:hypothetical protein